MNVQASPASIQEQQTMSTRNNPSQEQPSTYFVQDRFNEEEMHRLQIQDQLLTSGMSGVLAEQADPGSFESVLDVGCGTGGWLIGVARTYPRMSALVGVDVSSTMIEYARAQAAQQQVGGRVEFRVMDALQMLEFPRASFDLVNQRLGLSFLRTWDWPRLLSEYQRVARPGGVIRITESNIPVSNSPAYTHLSDLFVRALSRSGHFFTPDDTNAVINELEHLLQRHGLNNVRTRLHKLEYRVGTPEGRSFYEDTKHVFRTLLPFFHKWSLVPADYEEIYQQALNDMQQPGCVVTWTLLTAWGTNRGSRHTHFPPL
jgi:ubiquinone/menaquinone biosynthesis C-methylase UbiE